MNKKVQNEALQQEFNKRGKHFRTILKIAKRRAYSDGPEDKRADDEVQSLTSVRFHWQTICIKKKKGLTSIENSVDGSIHGLEDFMIKTILKPNQDSIPGLVVPKALLPVCRRYSQLITAWDS